MLLKFAGVSNHVMRHSNIVVFLPSKRPKFRVRLSLVFCQLFCSYCFSPPFHIFFLMVCFPFNSYCRRFRFFETHSLPRMQCPPRPPLGALPKISEKSKNTKSKWHEACFTVWARRCTYQEDSVPISGMISRLGENTLEIHSLLSSFAFERKIDYPQSGFSASEHIY